MALAMTKPSSSWHERDSMKVLSVPVFALLQVAQFPTTGIVPLSDGLAKVTRQGSGAWVPTSELKTQGIQEAALWCESRKQKVRVIDVKESQAKPFGGWPEAEVLFKCE
jgi:hypothetical protein